MERSETDLIGVKRKREGEKNNDEKRREINTVDEDGGLSCQDRSRDTCPGVG